MDEADQFKFDDLYTFIGIDGSGNQFTSFFDTDTH
jgi:hypothetical protein